MSNIQRWSLLVLAVAVLVVGYLVLRPKDDDDSDRATTVTQVVTVNDGQTTTTQRTTTTQTPAQPQIQTTIDKKTVKVKGKKRGLLEAVGGCKGGSRAVTLELTQEAGGVGTSKGSAKC
jgi:hypothetical protein